VQLTDGDINQWMKRVEMASEFAISEVFSPQKTHTGKTRRVVPLQNAEQLQDHDDAYSEAQAVLSDWMNRKLLHELEMDEEGEELICSNEMQTPELIALNQSANLNYKNFDDMYSHLAQEDESFVVHNFLQDLMETEVLDSGISEDLCLDPEKEKKRGRDPGVTMELRHRQVKENRVRREAAQERQRREAEVRREAREQARRLEWAKQRRKQQEARKQEELLQQEVIRLRREMQGKRRTEQLARKMERERLEELHCSQQPVTSLTGCGAQRRLCCREQQVEAKVHILHLQCMQKHFSGWYSVVLEKRVRLACGAFLIEGSADKQARTESTLQANNSGPLLHRRCQVAVESDWRRLMRRCLNDWRLWCRMEKERRELLSQQEETKRKMADLISAAASGKLAAESCTEPPITALHNACNQSDEITRLAQGPVQRASLAHTTSTLTDRKAAPPTQAWQVTRRHAALSPEDLHQARHGPHLNAVPRCWSAEVRGGRFEHRHAVQKQTIAEQRRLLREQQELISHLQETQNFLELRQEAERSAEAAAALSPVHVKHAASRSGTQANAKGRDANTRYCHEQRCLSSGSKSNTLLHSLCLPLSAMEERALLRAERRQEVEDMKRRREEERQAQMKAAEEERQRQEEKEKRLAAERRKDERRQQRERELEKQKRAETEQQLLKRAVEHYHRSLLLHRGLAPWKRLVAGSQTRMQMKRQQTLLGEQAEHFFRARVQRKAFNALLDHATHKRLVAWENTQQAAEHSARQLLRRCFGGWRHLPMVLREEREREARRQRLRRMVAEVLPDFRSSRVDGLWSSAPRL
ncbi:hypothetical protein P4O66_004847, partial [Electrophorus voltai]